MNIRQQILARKRLPMNGFLALTLLLVGGAACGSGEPSAENSPSAATRAVENGSAAAAKSESPAATASPASLGEGFAVWESNRSGAWRIWMRQLGESAVKQLTPDEPGRNHCCAHISPDGRWVTYLSFRGGGREYNPAGMPGELRLISPQDGSVRVVARSARTYFQHRAAVWKSSTELIYIAGDRQTMLLDLESGERRQLTTGAPGKRGWLIDPTLSTAFNGTAAFCPFDAKRGLIAARDSMGGCEAYVTQDGDWGFWAAGGGGPIKRVDLASRDIGTILEKNDPRLPGRWGYLYFPMVSRDGTLFTWGASQGQHDQHTSDYEIFAAPLDPERLELVGPPVRLTHHPKTDRYPDIWREPLELGRHRGEVPFTVQLAAPRGGEWNWSLGDGSKASGQRVEHTYRKAGTYQVVARRGETRLQGLVVTLPAAAPRVAEVGTRRGGSEIRVVFDEPVDATKLEARLEEGPAIAGTELSQEGRTLTVRLAEELSKPARLHLAGVADRADRPNAMSAQAITVKPPRWPTDRGGLAFLWRTAGAPNLVYDEKLGADRAITLTPQGQAHFNHAGAMVLDGGAFIAGEKAAKRLVTALKNTNQLSVEMVIEPFKGGPKQGRDSIVAFTNGGARHNFTVGMRGKQLVFTLGIAPRGPGAHQQIELFPVPIGQKTHVVVTYSPGRLRAYRNGELMVETDAIRGHFFHWSDYWLVFGWERQGREEWSGTLEGVAIYNRVLPPAEVAEDYRRYRAMLEARPEVPRAVVQAQLVERSKIPTLQEINPYREALVAYEYVVEKVISGEAPERVRVAHWALLDGKRQPATTFEVGSRHRLTLEPFAANEQLSSLVLSDTLQDAGSLPLYYAILH